METLRYKGFIGSIEAELEDNIPYMVKFWGSTLKQ